MFKVHHRELIKCLVDLGYTDGKEIAYLVNVHLATVYRVKIRVSQSRSLKHVGGARRSFLLNVNDRRAIAKWLAVNNNLSEREISAKLLTQRQKTVSIRTVQRFLLKTGYSWIKPPVGAMINGNNKAKCVQWCTNNFPAIDWQSVVFSDEPNISLHRNKVKVWTKYPKSKIPSPTKALSIGVGGLFSSRGISPLEIFDGRIGCEQQATVPSSETV